MTLERGTMLNFVKYLLRHKNSGYNILSRLTRRSY